MNKKQTFLLIKETTTLRYLFLTTKTTATEF